MIPQVLATNEMKSNLAAHIRAVAADPAARAYVGAHRKPQAVLTSVEAEFPYKELGTAIGLVGRALGLELRRALADDSGDPPLLHEYERVVSALAHRGQGLHSYQFMAHAVRALGGHDKHSQRRALKQLDALIGGHFGTDDDRAALIRQVEDSIAGGFQSGDRAANEA